MVACFAVVLLTGSDWRDAMVLRAAEGKGLRVDHFVRWGLWWAALIDGALALLLLLTFRCWWTRPAAEVEVELPPAHDNANRARATQWWIAVGVLVLLALGIRWQRMDLSLYNDEAEGFSRYIAGSFKGGVQHFADEEPVEFLEASWLDTLWANPQANNHGFHSVTARLAYQAWQKVTGGVPGQVQEIPLRLPALFGGLLSLVGVALLGRSLSFPVGGLFAALLLAVHPWHLRYSTEARGYGLLLAFAALAAWCLVRALRESAESRSGERCRPRWRWWLGFAGCQAAYLWANLGGVYLAAGMNLAVLAGLAIMAWRKVGFSEIFRSPKVRALLVANALSVMLLSPLVLPSVPQISAVMKINPVFQAGLPFGVERDVLSNLLIGMPWYDGDPENPFNPAVMKYAAKPATWLGLVVAGLAFAAGFLVVLRRAGVAALVVAGALIGLALPWMNSTLTGATLLPWYVIFALPFVTLCIGCGVASLAKRLAGIGNGARPGEARRMRYIGYAVVAVIVWAGYPALSSYQHHGKQALRDVIVAVRDGVYPFSKDEQRRPIVLGWWTEAAVYDPRLRSVWQVDQLQSFIDKARREKRPLFFILGKREAALAENAAVVAMIDDGSLFEVVKIFPGLEQRSYREHLYRLLPEDSGGRDKPLAKQPSLAASELQSRGKVF